MNQRKFDTNCMEGRLPALAPLANPFVPYQMERAEKYEARKALIRGTLYPGLDLPFKGKQNQKRLPVTPTSELQTLAFAVQELALYLDTHREDKEALELYKKYQKMLKKCTEEYERIYGPLNHHSACDSEEYLWLNDPWPWEYAKNREG